MFDATIHVLTVSDRAFAGEYVDTAGPQAILQLQSAYPQATVTAAVVGDGIESVQQGILEARRAGARVVITLGGTGVSPRDFTPEASQPLIAREMPGIAEAIRRAGSASTPMAVVSRGLAGVIDADADCSTPTLLVNLAGSLDAAQVGCAVLTPLLEHIVGQLDGRRAGAQSHLKEPE